MYKTTEAQKIRLYEIASIMNNCKIDEGFIADAVKLGGVRSFSRQS